MANPVTPPDPKEVVDSIGDGVVSVLQTGSRLLKKQGALSEEVGDKLVAIGEDIKTQMPDRPEVLARAVVETVGCGVKLVVGTAGNIAASLSETGSEVKKQVSRIIKE